MRKVFCYLCLLLLLCADSFAADQCDNFAGMWAPVYDKTYAEFPHMRPFMDGPAPAEDSFIKGLLEARRIVISCAPKSLVSMQGDVPSPPTPFVIDSANAHTMVIYCIAERFISPKTELERAMAETLRETAPRVTLHLQGRYLYLQNPSHESFVMQRAQPFVRR